MAKVLVTGGTGVLGKALSKIFLANQTDFIIASRHQNSKNNVKWVYMDLMKNDQLSKPLNDRIDTVLHLASIPLQRISGQAADVTLTKNLLNSIEKANVKHLVYISIVGIDRIPFSYYEGKLECERLIEASGIPYTILRATQFHDLVDAVTSKLLTLPIAVVPKALKIQPIQVEAVAEELNKIVQRSPLNSTYNLGGKRVYNIGEIVDSLLKARRQKKLVLGMPVIGKVMKAFAEGKNTCDAMSSTSTTWEEYVSNKYRP